LISGGNIKKLIGFSSQIATRHSSPVAARIAEE